MVELLLCIHKDLSLICNVSISKEGRVLCYLKVFLNFSQNQFISSFSSKRMDVIVLK